VTIAIDAAAIPRCLMRIIVAMCHTRAMKELKGKVAVVTGGASGIGLAMAERFAREGMKVVLADIEDSALAKAKESIAKSGAEVIAVRTDVSKGEQVDALRVKTIEAFGAVHVLCNNAGVGAGGLLWERSIADWEWTLGVNLWGVIHGVRAFVPKMIEQGEGHVVNTASMAGLLSVGGLGPYCVSKHSVVTMSECLHHELTLAAGGKVKVSVLCPGFVQTNISDSERNRPDALKNPKRTLAPHEQMMEAMMRARVAGGIPAADVADHVVRAIRDERFYIFTHPDLLGAFKRRADEILEQKTPTFDPTQI
jgi:NAD(P)-dependent dehydrogenase (short-subunit alcohol dehydrogenase family)